MSLAFVLAGLGFGDEGKGTVVSHIAHTNSADVVVRYNGGAQAAHNVVEGGRHHTFSQFGSGTFVSGCRTHLSRYMLVNPIFMRAEEAHLQEVGVTDAYDRMTVEHEALVTTPLHVSMNRLRELVRGGNRHGSCGMGIGETQSDALEFKDSVIRVKDLDDEKVLRRKLEWLREIKWEDANKILKGLLEDDSSWRPNPAFAFEWSILSDANIVDKIVRLFLDWRSKVTLVDRNYLPGFLHDQDRTAIFEGAQGVLLDEWLGFHPYTTWSTTTFKNADELLKGTDCEITKIGVLRAYQTRHGAGPFPTEDAEMTRELVEAHNSSGHNYQQGFRVGAFDSLLLRYAMQAVGHVDELAVTHLDRLPGAIRVCTKYQREGVQMTDLPWINPPSLSGQQELGRIIGCMSPVYETFSNHEDFFRHLENVTKRPVRICSYGPSASDKVCRQRHLPQFIRSSEEESRSLLDALHARRFAV